MGRQGQGRRGGEQGVLGGADGAAALLGQHAGIEGQHIALGVRGEAKGVRHPWGHHQGQRAAGLDACFVQLGMHAALPDPQELVQAVVDVSVDLPDVQAAARDDGLNVQHP